MLERFSRRLSMPPVLLVVIAALLLSSCSSQQRVLETLMASKAGSVGDWKNRKLDGASLLDTVTMNTALLLSPAEGLEVESRMENDLLTVEFNFAGKKSFGHGSAVPVTRDGYFLTASHCLEGPRSALIVFDDRGETMRVIKSGWRTVWRSPDKAKLDLAIIYAPMQLGRAFTVIGADRLEPHEPVAIAGWSGFVGGTPMSSNAAGKVLRISEKLGTLPGPVWRVIGHDAPMHPGDSGGPLVDRRGRLIGVHSLIRVNRWGATFSPGSIEKVGYLGETIAPDVEWLNRVIEADRSARR